MSNLIGKLLLNRYQVNSFLDRGGMAEVYQVWDSQRMTFLAIKILGSWKTLGFSFSTGYLFQSLLPVQKKLVCREKTECLIT